MPNLVAIVDPKADAESLRADLTRMMDAVDLPAFGFERPHVVQDGVAAGNVLPGMNDSRAQPARAGDRWLMLDGEILNGAQLKADLRRAGHEVDPGDDDAQLALAAYLAFGADFFERLQGTWNLVFHDGGTGHTYVVTDRLGSRLLFHSYEGGRFCCANEMKGIVAGRKVASKPGGVGLYALLSAGVHHGTKTWIDGIELVPPGTMIRIGPDGRRDVRYWRFAFNEGGPEMSEDEYAGAFARTLRAATERCMKQADRHDIAITLSGGLDSRAVALALDKRHLPMSAITYGDEESADVRYAKQLAEVIGLDHLYIERERARLEENGERVYRELTGETGKLGFYSVQADQILWRSEALTNFDGLASPIWHPIYREHMRFMLNGAAGDAMTGSHLSPDHMLYPNRGAVVDSFVSKFFFQDPELVRQVLNPAYFAQAAAERDQVFRSDFDEIDADEPLAVSNIWDMENRQRRGAFTSFVMERYFCDCRSPFLDYELCDVLSRVPGRWRFQQRIYKRMFVEHFPEAAHVPWAYTEGRITKSPAYEFAREAMNFGRERLRRMLPSNQTTRQRWDFRDVVGMMQKDEVLHRMLADFTKSDLFPSDVFDAAGIRQLGEDFAREGDQPRQVLFSHLLGIGRVIQMILTPSRPEVPASADPSRYGVATK